MKYIEWQWLKCFKFQVNIILNLYFPNIWYGGLGRSDMTAASYEGVGREEGREGGKAGREGGREEVGRQGGKTGRGGREGGKTRKEGVGRGRGKTGRGEGRQGGETRWK